MRLITIPSKREEKNHLSQSSENHNSRPSHCFATIEVPLRDFIESLLLVERGMKKKSSFFLIENVEYQNSPL